MASSDGPPPASVEVLVERYEQLRAQAVGDTVGGPRLGAGLLIGKGMVAWIKVAGACPAASPLSPRPTPGSLPPAGAAATEVVRVLAAMVIGAVSAGG